MEKISVKKIMNAFLKKKRKSKKYEIRKYGNYMKVGQSQMTYSDYLDYWMKEYFEINYKYLTTKKYLETFEAIKNELGKYKLCDLTPYILNQALLKLYQNSNSKEYLRNYQKVIKSSLRDAANYFGFIKNNPAVDLQIPRFLSFDIRKNDIKHIYTQDEIDKILTRFKKNDTFTCAFLTACYTGMRTGEIFALTWDDIDFKRRIIKISKTVYSKKKDYNGRWYLGPTKTECSCREIYICNTLYKALYNYKCKQNLLKKKYGNKYKKYYLKEIKNKYGKIVEYKIIETKYKRKNNIQMVFTKKDGSYSGTDIIKYPYEIIHNELGITNCRFYDLRGSFATKSLYNGAEIKDISMILGHNNIETTANYYIKSSKKARIEANKKFEATTHSKTIENTIKYH